MYTEQALVTLGGNGTRIKEAGIPFEHNKGFIEVEGKPICYWNMLTLNQAGVRKLVIICETQEKLKASQRVVDVLPCAFEEVLYVQNFNEKGATGLPYHARRVLDPTYFYQYGHNLTTPEHYREMDRVWSKGTVVYSAFEPNGRVSRPMLNGKYLVAPYLFDLRYAQDISDIEFDQFTLIDLYVKEGRIRTVESSMPVEFDIIEEYQDSIKAYKELISRQNIRQLQMCVNQKN